MPSDQTLESWRFQFLANQRPFDTFKSNGRPAPAAGDKRREWAERTLKNLEEAAAGGELLQRLTLLIEKALSGRILGYLENRLFARLEERLKNGSIQVYRRNLGGVEEFTVSSMVPGFEESMSEWIHSLIGPALAEVIDAKIAAATEKKGRGRKTNA